MKTSTYIWDAVTAISNARNALCVPSGEQSLTVLEHCHAIRTSLEAVESDLRGLYMMELALESWGMPD